MLKKLSMLLMAVLFISTATAQVTITKNEDPARKLAGLTQVSGLMISNGEYLLYMVTDNRFDDPVFLSLGTDTQTCIETLEALGQVLDGAAKGESYTLNDIDDVPYSVRKVKYVDCVKLYSRTRAGEASLHRAAITRGIKWFKEHPEGD